MILEGLVGGKLKSLYGVLRFGAFFFFFEKIRSNGGLFTNI